MDLQNLGNSLGLRFCDTEAARTNKTDIRMAAREMLSTWYKRNEDPTKAWDKLAEALRNAGLNIFVAQVLMK